VSPDGGNSKSRDAGLVGEKPHMGLFLSSMFRPSDPVEQEGIDKACVVTDFEQWAKRAGK